MTSLTATIAAGERVMADQPVDMDRLLWVLCRGLCALNNGWELDPQERLFLRVCEKRLAALLGEAEGQDPHR
jgi:hypothetical protein